MNKWMYGWMNGRMDGQIENGKWNDWIMIPIMVVGDYHPLGGPLQGPNQWPRTVNLVDLVENPNSHCSEPEQWLFGAIQGLEGAEQTLFELRTVTVRILNQIYQIYCAWSLVGALQGTSQRMIIPHNRDTNYDSTPFPNSFFPPIHSFIHTFINLSIWSIQFIWFIHLSIHLFVHSFIHSFMWLARFLFIYATEDIHFHPIYVSNELIELWFSLSDDLIVWWKWIHLMAGFLSCHCIIHFRSQ